MQSSSWTIGTQTAGPSSRATWGQPRALKEFLAENPQFQKTDIGPYNFFGRLAGHVFILKRVGMAMVAAIMLLAGSAVSPLQVQMADDEEKREDRHTQPARGLFPAMTQGGHPLQGRSQSVEMASSIWIALVIVSYRVCETRRIARPGLGGSDDTFWGSYSQPLL
jgi:hypothetical protein